MLLIQTDKRGLRKSDFGITVAEGSVEVPALLKNALDRLAVRTAEQLVSFLQAFPSALAVELGWTIADVLRAREAVVRKLKGHLPDAILNPAPIQVRGRGALEPPAVVRRGVRR